MTDDEVLDKARGDGFELIERMSAGASVKGVRAMLGHASAMLTLEGYGHLFGDDLDAVADRMDAARASADFRGLIADQRSSRSRRGPPHLLVCWRPREDSNLRTRFRNRPGVVFATRSSPFVQVRLGAQSGRSIPFLPVSSS